MKSVIAPDVAWLLKPVTKVGYVFLILAANLVPTLTQAHVVLLDPSPRTPDTALTTEPCGDKAKGASVATYLSNTNIEISFDLTIQHRANTAAYISFDDFATSTKLAMMRTPESGVYKMTAPLPVEPIGPAVLQIIHQNYYSCADITVEQGPEFIINAGLNDAWYNPLTDGQGFFITVFPELGLVSMAWFTYDTQLPSEGGQANLGDAGHRWITAVGNIDGNQVLMNIEMTSGGLFDAASNVQRTDPPGSDGTILLTFASCNLGTLEYDIPSINRQGAVPIERVANDNIVLCEALKSE